MTAHPGAPYGLCARMGGQRSSGSCSQDGSCHFFVQRALTFFCARIAGLFSQSSGISLALMTCFHRGCCGSSAPPQWSIQNLTAPRDVALPRQMAVELPEQRLHHARLRQRHAVEPDRLGVRHPVLQSGAGEPHERQPVTHLIRDLIVGQVVERAQHQRLEHH